MPTGSILVPSLSDKERNLKKQKDLRGANLPIRLAIFGSVCKQGNI
jgi:hypothetical protein